MVLDLPSCGEENLSPAPRRGRRKKERGIFITLSFLVWIMEEEEWDRRKKKGESITLLPLTPTSPTSQRGGGVKRGTRKEGKRKGMYSSISPYKSQPHKKGGEKKERTERRGEGGGCTLQLNKFI